MACMVTFQTVDPLFVIDLARAAVMPKILGELEIPILPAITCIRMTQHLSSALKVDHLSMPIKVHTNNAVYYTAILAL